MSELKGKIKAKVKASIKPKLKTKIKEELKKLYDSLNLAMTFMAEYARRQTLPAGERLNCLSKTSKTIGRKLVT